MTSPCITPKASIKVEDMSIYCISCIQNEYFSRKYILWWNNRNSDLLSILTNYELTAEKYFTEDVQFIQMKITFKEVLDTDLQRFK